MKRIWAPWRVEYIRMEKPKGCILCDKPKESRDAENYILFRGKKNFVMLNAFPYNPGHLMIAPYRHVAGPEDLTPEERNEHFEIINRTLGALRAAFNAPGFNIGMNVGKVAGAGIDDHFHTHIVPRWAGDTNFMPIMADTKVVSEGLADSYRKLVGKF